jgi:hypothetical protein
MNTIIDIGAINASLITKRFKEDERRIGLFLSAVAKKTVELATSSPTQLQPFVSASADLVSRWIAKPRKLSLGDLFKDPFSELRKETRLFAADWDLDPVFRKAMGL